jgi:hypothetical protein
VNDAVHAVEDLRDPVAIGRLDRAPSDEEDRARGRPDPPAARIGSCTEVGMLPTRPSITSTEPAVWVSTAPTQPVIRWLVPVVNSTAGRVALSSITRDDSPIATGPMEGWVNTSVTIRAMSSAVAAATSPAPPTSKVFC